MPTIRIGGQGQAAGGTGPNLSRRRLLSGGAALCLAGAAGACGRSDPQADGNGKGIAPADISHCEQLMDLAYTAEERSQVLASIDDQLDSIRALHAVKLANTDAPATIFDPRLPGVDYGEQSGGITGAVAELSAFPADVTDLAYAPAHQLAGWIRDGQISSRELTQIYLDRIAAYNPLLENFITVTGELALEQAQLADHEIASGRYRGPLHGLPYGIKDLIDTAGIATTWGATPYRNRVAERNAYVVERLREAGAVLIGKTTTGALAYGDQWFDGRTRNPWNPAEGSSGSSAGSASATAAGMCAFSIGTETLGSVVTPAARCGTAGLRPTFGRVPRTGTMSLCWSLDKIGPLCRSVADLGLVLAAINGHDSGDPSAFRHGFEWNAQASIEGMRVGYMPEWFEAAADPDQAALAVLREMPVELVELSLPDLAYGTLFKILEVEAAAAFEELSRSGEDDTLLWQADRAWPNTWRRVHFYSAVDLVQLDRLRRKIMRMMHDMMNGIDAIISPNFDDQLLLITTFTGHPNLTLRAGFVERRTRTMSGAPMNPEDDVLHRVPENIMLWGPLLEERKMLSLGVALEAALNVSHLRPPL